MKFSGLLLIMLLLSQCGGSGDEDIKRSNDEPEDPTFSVSGTVIGDSPQAVSVSINGVTDQTNSNGEFMIEDMEPGSYTLTASKTDVTFVPSSFELTITDADFNDLEFLSIDQTGVYHDEQVWRKFNPDVYDITVNTATDFRLDLIQNALWFENDEGGLVYQEITGDFSITASVKGQKASNYSEVVDCFVCLGGLMARDPDDSNGENYLHIVTGFTPEGLGVETKNTVDGSSEYVAVNDGLAEFDLRMCRSGSTFYLYKKPTGTTEWTLAATHVRADLPATVQVGMNIYTFQEGELADLSVLFSDIVIETQSCSE